MTRTCRITATTGAALSVTATNASVTASAQTRMIAGPLVVYGVVGRTSRGPLRVRPGALRFPTDLGRVKLTREHERDHTRGHLVAIEHTENGIRASFRVSDGPEGDAALAEAQDRTRDALSFDIVDATIVGDEITDALVIAGGQVGIPAYDDARIDTVAASLNPGDSMFTPEMAARLLALQAQDTRTDEEQNELDALLALSELYPPTATPAPEPVAAAAPAAPVTASAVTAAASVPAVPAGAPHPSRSTTTTAPRAAGAFQRFVEDFTNGLARQDRGAITAALADITHSAHTANIEQPAWSGELFSGQLYQPEWTDLFNSGDLTNWSGIGWRFTSKLEIADYAGDKAEIPTDNVTTASSSYTAARMAVGVDIDRKFFDFPNEGFVQALFEQVRESWAMKLDAKIRAYVVAEAVTAEGVTSQTDLLKAVALARRALKRRRVGTASWIYVNDDDMFTLMDLTNFDVPALLDLWGVEPRNFRSSPDLAPGTVYAGVKQAATVRTLPGSPIRVEAQNLTNAGIDEAFFGYWAIEEHHTAGIAKVAFDPTP